MDRGKKAQDTMASTGTARTESRVGVDVRYGMVLSRDDRPSWPEVYSWEIDLTSPTRSWMFVN